MTAPVDLSVFSERLSRHVAEARAAGCDADLSALVVTDAMDLCAELEKRRHRRDAAERAEVLARVRKLTEQLRDHDPNVLIQRIRSSEGVGRTQAYELRKAALSPVTKPDFRMMESDADK